MKNKNKSQDGKEKQVQNHVIKNEKEKTKEEKVPSTMADQFRWLFRLKESKQSGILGILQVKQLLMSIITQIYSSEEECEDLIELVMKGYNLDLYEEGNMLVTEEEFVYDSMRNEKLIQVIASYNVVKAERDKIEVEAE